MSARDPRDEVEAAYFAACRICLALHRLSDAIKGNRKSLEDDAGDKPWPATLFNPFQTLAKQASISWKATGASIWIPPRKTKICGITETSMHAAMSALADDAMITLSLSPELGRPSPKATLSRYADFDFAWADGMLRVERMQALAAIEGSEAAGTLDISPQEVDQGHNPSKFPTDNGKKSGPLMPDNADVRDLCALLAKQAKTGKSLNQIAREFTQGNSRKAASLLRQARRFRHLWNRADN